MSKTLEKYKKISISKLLLGKVLELKEEDITEKISNELVMSQNVMTF